MKQLNLLKTHRVYIFPNGCQCIFNYVISWSIWGIFGFLKKRQGTQLRVAFVRHLACHVFADLSVFVGQVGLLWPDGHVYIYCGFAEILQP